MDSKLTLSVNTEVIAAAKKLAKVKGKSLSQVVEEILLELLKFNQIQLEHGCKAKKIKFSPELKKIRGLIKLEPDFDLKQAKLSRLTKKYL
ncbi:MAG: DUF6364 family protein [Candidatus Melainabacteria bacterium]|nr:DUF6364 family protein [Candidatus Melainabacteria bacterium]